MSAKLYLRHDVVFLLVNADTQVALTEPLAKRFYWSFEEDAILPSINDPVINDIIDAFARCEVSGIIHREIRAGMWHELKDVYWKVVGTTHRTYLLTQDPRAVENPELKPDQLESIDRGVLQYCLASAELVNTMLANRAKRFEEQGEDTCPKTRSQ